MFHVHSHRGPMRFKKKNKINNPVFYSESTRGYFEAERAPMALWPRTNATDKHTIQNVQVKHSCH